MKNNFNNEFKFQNSKIVQDPKGNFPPCVFAVGNLNCITCGKDILDYQGEECSSTPSKER